MRPTTSTIRARPFSRDGERGPGGLQREDSGLLPSEQVSALPLSTGLGKLENSNSNLLCVDKCLGVVEEESELVEGDEEEDENDDDGEKRAKRTKSEKTFDTLSSYSTLEASSDSSDSTRCVDPLRSHPSFKVPMYNKSVIRRKNETMFGRGVLGVAPVHLIIPPGGTKCVASRRVDDSCTEPGDHVFFVTGSKSIACYNLSASDGKCQLIRKSYVKVNESRPDLAVGEERVYVAGTRELQSFSLMSVGKNLSEDVVYRRTDVSGKRRAKTYVAVDTQALYVVGTYGIEVRELHSLKLLAWKDYHHLKGNYCTVAAKHKRVCIISFRNLVVFEYDAIKNSRKLVELGRCFTTTNNDCKQQRAFFRVEEQICVEIDPRRMILYAAGQRFLCIYDITGAPRLLSYMHYPKGIGNIVGCGHLSVRSDGKLVYIVGSNGIAAISVTSPEHPKLKRITDHNMGRLSGGEAVACTDDHVMVVGIRGVETYSSDVAYWLPPQEMKCTNVCNIM